MQNLDNRTETVTTCRGRFRIERACDPSVRVPDFVLKCVGFVGEATHRDPSGVVSGDLHATGFFVSVPCDSAELRVMEASSVYFVTAKHVANDLAGREHYFLVNKIGGGTLAIDSVMGNRWWTHPTDTTADVAVAQVSSRPEADVISVHVSQLGTPQRLASMDIGVGDEVYTTGLFTPAPGIARNIPIVRYGNIAMMAGEEIQTELGYASVHLVESRSIGGISGSPVFVRPTIRIKVGDDNSPKGPGFSGAGDGRLLLGVTHGHWDIREAEMNKAFIDHDRKHGVNLGIAIVVPASKILDVINRPELMKIRKDGELREVARSRRNMVPGMDSARLKDEKVDFTRADFDAALKKASRKIRPEN